MLILGGAGEGWFIHQWGWAQALGKAGKEARAGWRLAGLCWMTGWCEGARMLGLGDHPDLSVDAPETVAAAGAQLGLDPIMPWPKCCASRQ